MAVSEQIKGDLRGVEFADDNKQAVEWTRKLVQDIHSMDPQQRQEAIKFVKQQNEADSRSNMYQGGSGLPEIELMDEQSSGGKYSGKQADGDTNSANLKWSNGKTINMDNKGNAAVQNSDNSTEQYNITDMQGTRY